MKTELIELIDFEEVDTLLEGFNKTTGFVTAIIDLDGTVLSKSGWRQICTDFHRINPETAKKCTVSDTELAGKLTPGEKYHFYKCLNGLVDVAVPIVINGEHIANLFSGQFFFEEPDRLFFKQQAEKYGFHEKKYLEALAKVPVVSKEKVQVAMDFLRDMTQLISEMIFQKLEQTELNKALKESEERFQLLFNKAPLGYQSLDFNGNFIDVNQQWLDTLGYGRDEVIGKWFGDFLTPLFQDGFRERFPIFKAQGNIHSEFEMVHKNGSVLFIAFDGKIGNDLHGNFKQTHCILQDITGQKRMERALRESEEKYRITFENNSSAILVVEKDTTVTMCNEELCRISGYTKNEIIGMKWTQVIYPEDLEMMLEYNRRRIESANDAPPKYEVRMLTKSGELRNVLLSATISINDKIIVSLLDITQRKQAEEKLRNSEEKFRILAESSSFAIMMHQGDYWIYANRAAEEISGYTIAELCGMHFWDFAHPDYRDLIKEKVYNRQQGKEMPHAYEFKIITKNGMEKWVSLTGNAIQFEDKNTALISVTDITERKLAEKELKESEDRFKKLSSFTFEGIIIHNNSIAIDVNQSFVEMIGYERDEIVGMNLFTIIHLDYHALVKENIIKEVALPYQIIVIRKDGSTFDAEIEARNVSYNGEYFRVACIRDITERKQSELIIQKKTEEIELQNQRLESLLKISQYPTNSTQELLDFALSEAINLTDSKIGYIYFYNETSKQFILNTWSKEVMQECKVMNPQTIYDLDKTGCWGEAVRQRKPIIINDYQAENPHKKGTPEGHIQLSKFLTIPVISDDKIVAVAGVANKENDYDSSDVRQLSLLMDSVWKISERILLIKDLTAAKLQAQESDRLKSAFLANMSHEIRTPMNGILGFAEILKDPELTGDQQQEYIKIIEKSGKRMLNIINDIVDISKIESGLMKLNLSESNINEQIEYIYTFFKPEVEAKGMKLLFNTTLSAQEATIQTDREKVYAIFTNLVKNAIKYSKNGFIEIGYVSTGSTTSLVGAHVEAQCIAPLLQFYVKDTGIGIPPDRQNAIFERFIQADIADKMARQGAGLGLAITKSYVEMLGGKIWVESQEGEGSTFYFTLPYNQKTETNSSEQTLVSVDGKPNWTKKLKILIAEDDPTSEMLISIMVNTFGREILKVETGTAAVETCRQNPDIDLIMMDIRMPEMGGYEATRQIREFNKTVVIIAQTAYGLSGDREKAIEAGCNDYIAKPIKKEELLGLIQNYFGK